MAPRRPVPSDTGAVGRQGPRAGQAESAGNSLVTSEAHSSVTKLRITCASMPRHFHPCRSPKGRPVGWAEKYCRKNGESRSPRPDARTPIGAPSYRGPRHRDLAAPPPQAAAAIGSSIGDLRSPARVNRSWRGKKNSVAVARYCREILILDGGGQEGGRATSRSAPSAALTPRSLPYAPSCLYCPIAGPARHNAHPQRCPIVVSQVILAPVLLPFARS